ncbi:MAG: SDR family oxidoreductase [Hyphomicrobiales bacterium]|jgi:NAD(P)-dependent dehydrogenase (short-subunit alcohol dehydrogenase family)
MSYKFLITGANKGIGYALTWEVLNKGCEAIALCRETSDVIHLEKLKNVYKDKLEIFKADVTDEDKLKDISININQIDVIICNAGIMGAKGGMFDQQNTPSTILNILMTNVAGPFFTIRAFLEKLKTSENPKIAIISSHMGSQQHGSSDAYFYRASKAAVNNLMVTFSRELQNYEIPVVSFHPGWVRTDMGGSYASLSPEESAKALIKLILNLNMKDSGNFFNYDGSNLHL